MARTPLYTIGYSGFTADRFVEKLKDEKIEILVDIRQRALSRKPGFSKTSLRDCLEQHGIEYLHLQDLGVPGHLRQELREDGDLTEYLSQFRTYLTGRNVTLGTLYDLARERPCCLMCVEHDVDECHRSVVAEELLLRNGRKLKVQHL
ncbi:MAG TPA: DUF488 domain-containing protein [Tepidisphaeraceae bacterium]|jgi:uncharacterized protein (DUF488 family)|nr:DUF488 domain-containing protein [Tepidisphaeraceae bacterium]